MLVLIFIEISLSAGLSNYFVLADTLIEFMTEEFVWTPNDF